MAATFSCTQHIAAPKQKVFDTLTNFEGTRNWMKGFVRVEMIKGDKVEAGAIWRATRKMFGKDSTEEFEATLVSPPNEIRMQIDGSKGTSGKGMYYFRYLLEEKNGETDVTMSGEIAGLKGIMAFFLKLFMPFFKKALTKDLKTLKEYLETGKKVE
jgi:carbon monoxide dehydrogenase subunit G